MDRTSQRLSLNHATLGPQASFVQLAEVASATGFGAVGVWLDRLDGMTPAKAGTLLRQAGLEISGVNRCGFFVHASATERQQAVAQGLRRIDACAELGAKTLIVVPGGHGTASVDVRFARDMVLEGMEEIIDHARAAGVDLAIEPFHPALTSTLGVINTLDLALDTCEEIGSGVGVATDILHIWWDPNVYQAIFRAGSRILAHHLCDWSSDATDAKADRALMGEGVADAARLTAAILKTGYTGWHEVEIFSQALWTKEPRDIADICLRRANSCMAEADRIAASSRC